MAAVFLPDVRGVRRDEAVWRLIESTGVGKELRRLISEYLREH